jgi:hypothetical protein
MRVVDRVIDLPPRVRPEHNVKRALNEAACRKYAETGRLKPRTLLLFGTIAARSREIRAGITPEFIPAGFESRSESSPVYHNCSRQNDFSRQGKEKAAIAKGDRRWPGAWLSVQLKSAIKVFHRSGAKLRPTVSIEGHQLRNAVVGCRQSVVYLAEDLGDTCSHCGQNEQRRGADQYQQQ